VLREVPDALLLLVGDGPNRSRVERLAQRLGVADSVIFTGSVPWEEMPAYTDAGDVFAMPCRTRLFGLEAEAFGIVFLEAAACGLPVVAGDSGGAPEVAAIVGGRVVTAIHVERLSTELAAMLMPPSTESRSADPGIEVSEWRATASRLSEVLVGG
jgi:phosphatidyl-myo-inositol dimannoside synthase